MNAHLARAVSGGGGGARRGVFVCVCGFNGPGSSTPLMVWKYSNIFTLSSTLSAVAYFSGLALSTAVGKAFGLVGPQCGAVVCPYLH